MAGVSRPTSRFQQRRGLTATWETANPILADGEFGVEVIVGGPEKIKVGDGETAWLDLDYASGSGEIEDVTAEVLALVLAELEPDQALLTIYLNARGA